MPVISLTACERTFEIHCSDEPIADLIHLAFGGLSRGIPASSQIVCRYHISARGPAPPFQVSSGGRSVELDDEDSLLLYIDSAITIALQHERRDLLFLHAAAVAHRGRVAVLAAQPGTGKSTLTLGLLLQGLEYLSDEIAPIDVRGRVVYPYPHALCLKSPPPSPWLIPPGTVAPGTRLQVPVESIPAVTRQEPLPLGALVFLQREGDGSGRLRSISVASSAARVLANALNPLAHPTGGLDAAVMLSQTVPGYELDISDLPASASAIADLLGRADGAARPV